MAVETELGKSLTLLRTSPTFILTERRDGQRALSTPTQITPDMGVVWAASTVTLANGQACEAVITLDTATGDIPHAVYLWVNDQWLEPASPDDRPALLAALNANETGVFPYTWDCAIPMALR